MVCMLTQSTQSNYIVDSNTKYSNYMKLWLEALNYNKIQNIILNYRYFELNTS